MEEKTIGEHTYEVRPLNYKKAMRCLHHVGMAFKDSIREFGDVEIEGESLDSINAGWEKVSGAIASFFEAPSNFESLEKAMDMLLPTTYVVHDNGKKSKLVDVHMAHFTKYRGEIPGWFVFACEVNFKDFFSGLGGSALHLPGTPTSSTSKSRKRSTGSSGESSSASDFV